MLDAIQSAEVLRKIHRLTDAKRKAEAALAAKPSYLAAQSIQILQREIDEARATLPPVRLVYLHQ